MKFVQEYASLLAQKNHKEIIFSLTTNGTLLSPDSLQDLNRYNTYVMLSLDSNKKEINDRLRPMMNGDSSYDVIQKMGWSTLLGTKKRKAIRVTITPENIQFFDIAKSYYEAGFTHVHVEEVKSEKAEFQFTQAEKEILKDEYRKLANYLMEMIGLGKYEFSCKPLLNNMNNLYKRRPNFSKCGILSSSISVAYDMKLYPCDGLMWDQYCLGDLNRGINNEVVNTLKEDLLGHTKCAKCWAKYLCGGVCGLEYLQAKKRGREEVDCDLELYKYQLQLEIFYKLIKNNPEYFKNIDRGFVNDYKATA